jgi:hypothetical protein
MARKKSSVMQKRLSDGSGYRLGKREAEGQSCKKRQVANRHLTVACSWSLRLK